MKFSNQSFYFIGITILFVLFSCEPVILSDQSLTTEQAINTDEGNKRPTSVIPVWAGGVPGFETFIKGDNHVNFRSKGGKLHVHHFGWINKLTKEERERVLTHFGNENLFLEIGFTDSWPNKYKRDYKDTNYWKPFAITSNCHAKMNVPTFEEWKGFVNEMKEKSGVSRIYPTFEYQNFHRDNKTILSNNLVSKRKLFQQMIRHSKGLTLDIPPHLFFHPTKVVHEYRLFVKDAIQWTHENGFEIYIILSANYGQDTFTQDCERIYNHLRNVDAIPDGYIINNYVTGTSGPEATENSSLHAGIQLLDLIKEDY